MALIGIAPLTLVRTRAGRSEYVYAGALAPEDIVDEDVTRLVNEGFLEEVEDSAVPDEVVVPDDPATGNLGEGVTVERPKTVSTKDLWVDYRVALNQLTEEQGAQVKADELKVTKEQLQDDDYMASFQQTLQTSPDAQA